MVLHKSVVIHAIRTHPEDLEELAPGFSGTPEEAIAALEKEAWEWKVGEHYMTDEEYTAYLAEDA